MPSVEIITQQLQRGGLDASTENQIKNLLGNAQTITARQFQILQGIIDQNIREIAIRNTYPQLNKYGTINIFNTPTAQAELTAYQRNINQMFNFGMEFTNKTPSSTARSFTEAIRQNSMKYVTNMGEDLKTRMGNILSNGRRNQLMPDEISRNLQRELRISKNRAEMICRTETMRAANYGSYSRAMRQGKKYFIIDSRAEACKLCRNTYNGEIFRIDELEMLPPLHPRCYDKNTEVYTSKGWKLFKDVKSDDLILSLNPQTMETDFIPFIQKIEYHYSGEMYYIHNKWFDMKITSDHEVFTMKRVDHGKKGRQLEPFFVTPDKLHSEHRIPRTCENFNKSPKYVDINGLKFKSKDYAFFMAWYIAEGSVLHDKKDAYKRGCPIFIAQQIPENREILKKKYIKIMESVGLKVSIQKQGFEVYSKQLYDYLVKLGRSHNKYIPPEVFNLSRDDLRVFLDNYVKGDGHERIQDNYMVCNSNDRVIFTSSPVLADDLSYIILLAGYYPSFYVEKRKGREVEFNNGRYKINNDLIRISINNTKHTNISNCNVDIVYYDDMVYCLELPKWHTLWVKRNNKTSWGGNCMCIPIYHDTLEEAKSDADVLKQDNQTKRQEINELGHKIPSDGTGRIDKGIRNNAWE
jgi:SPP1 gp7 family putative phage head morphogenesis protein